MTDFIAFDVETANSNLASICQVGVAYFSEGSLSDTWKTYVNPETYFGPLNVSIHGIEKEMVADAIKIPELINELIKRFDGKIIVHHTAFDRVSLTRAIEIHGHNQLLCRWLDTARVSRRTWERFRSRGYGIRNIADDLGISFVHHDALEDACAAGEILLKAISESGVSLENWLEKAYKPISSLNRSGTRPILQDGDPDGEYFGETIVFTGALSVPRADAAKSAACVGFRVTNNVSRETDVLVVGDQDIQKLAGHQKSSKHRKAEELISAGHLLRIIGKTDFFELIAVGNKMIRL